MHFVPHQTLALAYRPCSTGPKIRGEKALGLPERWPGPGHGAESCLLNLSLHSAICPKLPHHFPKPELQGHQQLLLKRNSRQRERAQWQVSPQEDASLLGVSIKGQRLHFSYSNLHQRAERILAPPPPYLYL